MGTIIKVRCPCGYESRTLFIGCGELPNSYRELASCKLCKKMISIRLSSKRHRCPTCGRKVQIISFDKNEVFGSTSILLKCPQCQNFTLLLEECGLWD
jgi:predicted RNA-binding Zn-ribbon protein involved in translation (DUF1610 family)